VALYSRFLHRGSACYLFYTGQISVLYKVVVPGSLPHVFFVVAMVF